LDIGDKEMKRKLMLTVATLLVLGMAIVAFAYTTSSTNTMAAAASCCSCCGDSCPMKNKDAKMQKVAMTGDQKGHSCDCCGDSCPMKNKDASTQTTAAGDAKATSDCSCCKGDSCPMKGEHASHEGMMMKHDGDMKNMKDGSCPCCHHNMEKKDSSTL